MLNPVWVCTNHSNMYVQHVSIDNVPSLKNYQLSQRLYVVSGDLQYSSHSIRVRSSYLCYARTEMVLNICINMIILPVHSLCQTVERTYDDTTPCWVIAKMNSDWCQKRSRPSFLLLATSRVVCISVRNSFL